MEGHQGGIISCEEILSSLLDFPVAGVGKFSVALAVEEGPAPLNCVEWGGRGIDEFEEPVG